MASLEIVDVRLAPSDHARLHGRNVEVPKAGQEVASRVLRLVGWVVGKDAAAVAVEIVVAGTVACRASVDVQRPDIAAAFPAVEDAANSGFRALVTVVSAEPHLDLEVLAVLASQERVPLARLRVTSSRTAPVTPTPARVSVVIPCYNQAHYLSDALASVAAQTHGQPEVIVVDDGSTDNTAAVAARYPGIRYIRQDNAGLAAARNTGLRSATAEHVVFLDADDRLMPSAFRIGLSCLADRPRDAFVFGAWQLIGHDGLVLPTPRQASVDTNAYRALLRMCFISTPAAVMYRRSAVLAAGGFDPAVSPSADYDLYLRLTRRSPVYCHGELVAEYRRHGANMTLNRAMMLRAELTVLRRQWPHVNRDPELVEALWEGLHRAQDYHGGRLARDVRAHAVIGQWQPALRGGLELLRHYPGALFPEGREGADAVSDLSLRLQHAARTAGARVRSGPADRYAHKDGDQSTWVS